MTSASDDGRVVVGWQSVARNSPRTLGGLAGVDRRIAAAAAGDPTAAAALSPLIDRTATPPV
jgi:hypothetical protein